MKVILHLSVSSFRCENAFFGSTQFNWLPVGRDDCLSKVSVASDYSDSVPDSSNYLGNHGYHPLEELKDQKSARKTKLTSAEIAKTAVEVHSRLFFSISYLYALLNAPSFSQKEYH